MTAARSQKIGRKRDGTAYECMKYILPKRIAQGRPLPQQKTSLPFGSEASLSKNPCQIAGQNGSSGIKENKSERRRSFPTPNRQLCGGYNAWRVFLLRRRRPARSFPCAWNIKPCQGRFCGSPLQHPGIPARRGAGVLSGPFHLHRTFPGTGSRGRLLACCGRTFFHSGLLWCAAGSGQADRSAGHVLHHSGNPRV